MSPLRENIKQNQILRIIQETDVDQLGTISVKDQQPESVEICQGIIIDLLKQKFGIQINPDRVLEVRTDIAATMITGGSPKEQRSSSHLNKQESMYIGQNANA